MQVQETKIKDVLLITPCVFNDERGYFFESFNHDRFRPFIDNLHFVQDNESMSGYGTLRGLHYQLPPFDQAKLVRVIMGKVLDIALYPSWLCPWFSGIK